MYNWERPADTLTLHIYPSGKSEYKLYEDDGLTRDHRKGIFATTKFEVSSPGNGNGPVQITLNAAKGDFKGRLKNRTYLIDLHTNQIPASVSLNRKKLKQVKNKEKFNEPGSSWYFDANDHNGLLHIKTNPLSTDLTSTVEIMSKRKQETKVHLHVINVNNYNLFCRTQNRLYICTAFSGRLAQSVQSIWFTPRGSWVRIPHRPP
jgi:hypothetical protein